MTFQIRANLAATTLPFIDPLLGPRIFRALRRLPDASPGVLQVWENVGIQVITFLPFPTSLSGATPLATSSSSAASRSCLFCPRRSLSPQRPPVMGPAGDNATIAAKLLSVDVAGGKSLGDLKRADIAADGIPVQWREHSPMPPVFVMPAAAKAKPGGRLRRLNSWVSLWFTFSAIHLSAVAT